jgi:hypothetical protein|tara:strand:+ start:4523 stop:5038 length:516 start_codon:yes stop_codon:yes gene_type:complete
MPADVIHPIVRVKKQLKIRDIKAGSLVEFKYAKAAAVRKPIVLVLSNGYYDKKINTKKNIVIHGVNLNYIPRGSVRQFKKHIERSPILGRKIRFDALNRDVKGQGILEENRYTQLILPASGEKAGESIAQLRVIMKTIYSTRIKPLAKKYDCFRIYNVKEISNVKRIFYKF